MYLLIQSLIDDDTIIIIMWYVNIYDDLYHGM